MFIEIWAKKKICLKHFFDSTILFIKFGHKESEVTDKLQTFMIFESIHFSRAFTDFKWLE